MTRKIAALIVLALFAARVVAQQPLLDRPQLVSTEWLAQRLNDPRLRIVDARPTLSAYLEGHIPGAIYLNTETLRLSRGGVPARLLPPERLAEIFGLIGIGNQHTVVVYSGAGDAFAHAAYIAFVLELLGHRSVGVLDGGWEKWQSEGRPVSREFPKIPSTRFVAKANPQVRTDWFRVWQGVKQKNLQVLDARSLSQFVQGHLPMAVHAFLGDNLTGDKVRTWRSPEELTKRLKELGIDPQKPIVVYCNSGREASQVWFTLKHVLNLPQVQVYDGSWIDWVSRQLPQEQ